MTKSALAAIATLALLTGISNGDLVAALRATAARYYSSLAEIAPIAGSDTTFDYYRRLLDDAEWLSGSAVPSDFTPAQWLQFTHAVARLDLSLAQQLLARRYVAMASIRGLGETLVRSTIDGTMQPVAVYVPPSYRPGRPVPLVVFLHGHPEPETQLLAPQYVADLANRTGSIVVAPWGHGYYDFRGSAAEVYDALDAAERAFSIDARRRYLVGYSMGGFSVFEVAPLHPQDWSAVMCIAGALLGHDGPRVIATLRRVPLYVLTGSADRSIPTQYPTATAVYLRSVGFDVSFYSEPGGTHHLGSLLPILTQAWEDMHRGVVRSPPPSLAAGGLPANAPIENLKP